MEDLIDTSLESDAMIAALRHTPSGAFGSCRYKLKGLEEDKLNTNGSLRSLKPMISGIFSTMGVEIPRIRPIKSLN